MGNLLHPAALYSTVPNWSIIQTKGNNRAISPFLIHSLQSHRQAQNSSNTKDRRGKATVRFQKSKRSAYLPFAQQKNRKLKLMSTYATLTSESSGGRGKAKTVRWVPTRAPTEPEVMLELLIQKVLKTVPRMQLESLRTNREAHRRGPSSNH